ncbi:66S pre-ribosomal particles component [Komagataella phaffii CBS 7435]|uniref:Constituent of 66S pre-ribosomal particles, required for large (60S) ribosomal subunit biogenesis n=2 Tax=Komagataella phaffii TaxID=460519 RepID=C4R3I8_KOMPG|nr:Constituent of 66S pre-ribosomal particles, required for large (60S) ribosomal subunit biogenesis [Komagataella phaffii GS115]AOA64351.1 GQ67_03109T0 [Komagataella phaffii]CAH2450256.1 66S pre-ribosomal particles component [Komagataella phaffii CBS 7435]AOA68996.1 GQ68_03093T0 [Komagataella phaffii GS115]CAY70023.1 Constituent of 66S pre-ribosomal particles, required for large (60S) ribosomal subunit biogenesis [Komagataella phaffii GS115]CCA40087.1 66S pre-ribosomal particles component [Ko
MSGIKLDLSSLGDKVSSKLMGFKPTKEKEVKNKKSGGNTKGRSQDQGSMSGNPSTQNDTSDILNTGDIQKDLSSVMKNIGLTGKPLSTPTKQKKKASKKQESKNNKEVAKEKSVEPIKNTKVPKEQERSKVTVKELSMKKSNMVTDFSNVITDKLSIPAQKDWYNVPMDTAVTADKLSAESLAALMKRGQEFLDRENEIYMREFSKASSQKKFLNDILTSGTLSDKISALTLLIQEAPLHNVKSVDALLLMCEKKSRTAALQSIEAVTDMLVNGILPDRKLHYFHRQPLNMQLSDEQLAIYVFEDHLKKQYFQFIGVLEHLLSDPISHIRVTVLRHIFNLLASKPEQEANLLRLGVNKLGDSDNKINSKTSYLLLKLEEQHPAMVKVILDAIIDVCFKSKEYHTQYYSVLTLNQTVLSVREVEIANQLVKTYFSLFEKTLLSNDKTNNLQLKAKEVTPGKQKKSIKRGKKGGISVKKVELTQDELMDERNSKLFSAILTGLNRALPYSKLPDDIFTKHLDTLFRITHSTNFNTSVQALILIHRITVEQNVSKESADRYYRTLYESLLDPRLITSSKQGIYLNLLFKSLKHDSNIERVMAFVKRIIQICHNWISIGTVSGMLYLLIQLEHSIPTLRNLVFNSPIDYPVKVQEDDQKDSKKEPTTDSEKLPTSYDPRQRDPRFAGAEKSSLWELNTFVDHFHPTVRLYARSLLDGSDEKVTKPDLGLYTLSHFLDKFVYKTAKKNSATPSGSIMQSLNTPSTGHVLVHSANVSSSIDPSNTEEWLSRKVSEINPEDIFFHQYFTIKKKRTGSLVNKKKKKKHTDDSDEEAASDSDSDIDSAVEGEISEGDASDFDEDEVWSALVQSNPEVEALNNDLDNMSDFDPADFDYSDSDEEEKKKDDNVPVQIPSHLAAIAAQEPYPEDSDNDNDNKFSSDEEAKIFGPDSEDELSSEDEKPKKKRARTDTSDDVSKKSKSLKGLPMFASIEDYADLLEDDGEDEE